MAVTSDNAYGFIKLTSETQGKGTHSFHEERNTEEIDFFLINENVDSALRNL